MENKLTILAILFSIGFIGLWTLITLPIWLPILLLNIWWIVPLVLLIKFTRAGDYTNEYYLRAYDWLVYRSEKPRRMVWQGFYEFMSWYCQDPDWVTMNYGYALLTDEGKMIEDLLTEEGDKSEIFSLQLYYFITGTQKVLNNMKSKTLLEVGSGRGGGISFLTRHFKPQRAVGIDFSANQVEFCKTRHSEVKALEFHQGDAEALSTHSQLGEGVADVVINVESSHCYGSIDNFLSEVNKVLKDDGVF